MGLILAQHPVISKGSSIPKKSRRALNRRPDQGSNFGKLFELVYRSVSVWKRTPQGAQLDGAQLRDASPRFDFLIHRREDFFFKIDDPKGCRKQNCRILEVSTFSTKCTVRD